MTAEQLHVYLREGVLWEFMVILLVTSAIGSLISITRSQSGSSTFKKVVDFLIGTHLGIVAGVYMAESNVFTAIGAALVFSVCGSTLLEIIFRMLPEFFPRLLDAYLKSKFGVSLEKELPTIKARAP